VAALQAVPGEQAMSTSCARSIAVLKAWRRLAGVVAGERTRLHVEADPVSEPKA
jgi:hypothetical protein